MKNIKPAAFFCLRIAVMLGALALVFTHVKLADIGAILVQTPLWVLAAAAALIHLTQLAAALRMKFYLGEAGITLPLRVAVLMQYVGELYGAASPGGAGGDIYKTWWLKRYAQGRVLSMAKIMVSARLNGVWALGVVACVLVLMAPAPAVIPHLPLLALAALFVGTVGYVAIARFALGEPLKRQAMAGGYSLLLQVALALAVWCICIGMNLGQDALAYVVLCLVSTIIALLPISVGGMGVRELTVLYGSRMLGIQEDHGVSIALMVTVISLTVPLAGAIIQSVWKHKQAATV